MYLQKKINASNSEFNYSLHFALWSLIMFIPLYSAHYGKWQTNKFIFSILPILIISFIINKYFSQFQYLFTLIIRLSHYRIN